MENTVLTNIQFNLNMEELISKMRVKEGSPYEQRLKEVAGEALKLGNLKAIYRGASIKEKGDDFVVIDETRFTSKILRNHLDQVENVFPFVVTCGNELRDWAESKKDILEMYWADVIKDMALEVAIGNIL